MRDANQRWRDYPQLLISENRWRAMRYSFDEGLLDLARGELLPFATLLDELIELVAPDARALGCLADVEHARTIVRRGTSAHQQVAVYERARSRGATEREALQSVVGWLREETARGLT